MVKRLARNPDRIEPTALVRKRAAAEAAEPKSGDDSGLASMSKTDFYVPAPDVGLRPRPRFISIILTDALARRALRLMAGNASASSTSDSSSRRNRSTRSTMFFV